MKKTTFFIIGTLCSFHLYHSQTLTFSYDSGGNQSVREYCDLCAHVQKSGSTQQSTSILEPPKKTFDVKIYPNPTKDRVTIVWSQETDLLIQKIEYVAYNYTQFRPLEFRRGEMKATIDLTKEPIGMYVVVFHLTNGEKLTYKILKH